MKNPSPSSGRKTQMQSSPPSIAGSKRWSQSTRLYASASRYREATLACVDAQASCIRVFTASSRRRCCPKFIGGALLQIGTRRAGCKEKGPGQEDGTLLPGAQHGGESCAAEWFGGERVPNSLNETSGWLMKA